MASVTEGQTHSMIVQRTDTGIGSAGGEQSLLEFLHSFTLLDSLSLLLFRYFLISCRAVWRADASDATPHMD